MKRQHRQLLSLWIGLLCLADRASALGLGDVKIYSHLGEPLVAEVQVLDQSNSQGEVRATIGKDSDYQALGIEYSALHAQLSFEPVSRNGQNYLRIRSDLPVHEPYVDFVLSLRDAQGQLLREVTILLDPKPQAVQPAPSSSQSPRLGNARAQASLPSAATAPAQANSHYRVQVGDSLWKIAGEVKPAELTQEQTMQAILAYNPGAFISGDPARLMLGSRLTIPSAQQIAALQHDAPLAKPTQLVATETKPTPAAVVARASADQSTPNAMPLREATYSQQQSELEQFLQQKAQLAADMRRLSETLASLNHRLAQATQTMAELKGSLPAPAEVIYPLALSALPAEARQLLAPDSVENLHPLSAPAAQADIAMPFMMVPPANAATTGANPEHQAWWNMLLAWGAAGGLGFWLVRRNRAKKINKGDGPVPLAWPMAKNWRELRARDPELLNAHSHEIANFNLPVSTEPEAVGDLTQELDSQLNKQAVISQLIAFGRYAEAEGLIMTALKINPDINSLQLLLLNIYLQTQRLEQFRKLEYKLAIKNLNSEELTQLAAIKANYVARYEQGEAQFNFRRVS